MKICQPLSSTGISSESGHCYQNLSCGNSVKWPQINNREATILESLNLEMDLLPILLFIQLHSTSDTTSVGLAVTMRSSLEDGQCVLNWLGMDPGDFEQGQAVEHAELPTHTSLSRRLSRKPQDGPGKVKSRVKLTWY